MTRSIIDQLLEEMERNVRHLDELKSLEREEFTGDHRHYLLAERCFQLAIQCLVDVSSYLASQKGWEKPADSAGAILLMGRQGVLTPEFARKIVGMANFRNILVHAYMKINRDLLYDMLRDLEDFREFARSVFAYLER